MAFTIRTDWLALCGGVPRRQAIVRTLDAFASHTAPLRAELTIRAATAETARDAPTKVVKGEEWKENGTFFDYANASNPLMSPMPVQTFPSSLHESGPTRSIPLDLSDHMGLSKGATSPNLQAAFLRIDAGEQLSITESATSHAFYVIRGAGETMSEHGSLTWSAGDIFALPHSNQPIVHHADPDSAEYGGAALYSYNDSPLLRYLGVEPSHTRFEPAVYRHKDLKASVEDIRKEPESVEKNRIGVLLSNKGTADTTMTLTHTLWALYDVLPPHSMQNPHRHAATALDMAIYAPPGGQTYTLMARQINSDGQLVDPVKVPWQSGGVFTTPPGWWHSHHNDSDEDTWVFPIQDAALLTYQRMLNIRFSPKCLEPLKEGRLDGAAFEGSKVLVPQEGHDRQFWTDKCAGQAHNLTHRD